MMRKIGLMAVAALVFTTVSVKAQTGSSPTPDKYTVCLKEASSKSDVAVAKCMNDRTEEILKEIKYQYETILKEDAFAKWSGGNAMQSGNLRDMFDRWLQYRDKYCAVYTVSLENYVGSNEFNQASCLMDLTDEHRGKLTQLLVNIKSEIY